MNLLKIKQTLTQPFTALEHKNFKIFLSGQIISLIGTWMQTISLPWLAYTITKSPLLLGLVGTLQFLPVLLFSLFVGALLDRFNKRRVLIFTQSTLAINASLFAFLVISGHIQYWHILILASIQGIVAAIDMPTRQSFMIEMVGKKDLMNAIALNSTIFNTARILGPAIAGLVMAQIGIGFCFLFNALSFLPLIFGLFFIKPFPAVKREAKKEILGDIADGLKYILSEKILIQTILTVLIVSTFIMNFNVLVPVFAKTVLMQNEKGFGLLMSCMGVGSLLGALTQASKSRQGPKRKNMIGAALLVACVFVAVSFTHQFFVSACLIALAGFLAVTFQTSANSTIQLNAKDEYRSRAISAYFLVNAGTTPLGNLFVGTVIEHFGIKICFILIGLLVFSLVSLLVFLTRNKKETPSLEPEAS